METCFRCGSSQNLVEAISEKEIVMICRRCQQKENLPIIRKVNLDSLSNERILTVQERLSRMSGVSSNPRAQREKMLAERKKREEALAEKKKQDEELRKVADKNFQNKLGENPETDTSGNSSMVRNFHWVIMRARRARKLTRRALADMINEPEAAIEMAEKGALPREREELVNKIQKALNIQITKIPYGTYTKLPEKTAEMPLSEETEDAEDLDFKEKEKRWTIGDLLRIKRRVKVKEREEEISQEEIDKVLEENSKE